MMPLDTGRCIYNGEERHPLMIYNVCREPQNEESTMFLFLLGIALHCVPGMNFSYITVSIIPSSHTGRSQHPGHPDRHDWISMARALGREVTELTDLLSQMKAQFQSALLFETCIILSPRAAYVG